MNLGVRVHGGEPRDHSVPAGGFEVGSSINRIIERHGANLAGDEIDEWWSARERATDPGHR